MVGGRKGIVLAIQELVNRICLAYDYPLQKRHMINYR